MGKGEKSVYSETSPINDETWEAFVFALYAGDNKPQDQPSNVKNTTPTIRWNQLYDSIGSGYRQRFTVLSKSDLIAWALENVKTYDICKEVKDNVDDIPDILLARLIRLWLTLSKQEGVEAKASYGNQGTNDSKKDSKKDKADKQSPSLLKRPIPPKGAPGAKANESMVAEEEDSSKRKNKLRDKTAGKNERVQAIGDEPEDGPDIYYALRGFESTGVLNLLVEECDVPIATVMTLFEGAKSDIAANTNTNFSVLRNYLARSSYTSSWRNVVWSSLENSEAQEPRELFDKVARKVYHVLNQRKSYNAFYAAQDVYNIPEVDIALSKKSELRFYETLFSSIMNENMVSEDVVLGIVLEQLDRFFLLEEDNSYDPAEIRRILPEETGIVRNHIASLIKKLPLHDGEAATAIRQVVQEGPAKSESKILKYADTHTLSSRKLRNLSAFGIYVSEVLTNILNRFPMERFQQIVSSALKKGLGSVNAAHRENVLLQSEFKRFSKLPETAARRALLQFDFEELLQDKFAKEYNFDAWCWAEDYDKATLTQILQNAKLDNPKVYARGCPREGVLLLAMMGAGEPLGKQAFDSFEFSVKSKVGLGTFTNLIDTNLSQLSPPSKNNHAIISTYAAGDRLLNFKQETASMFPDTGAKVTVTKTTTPDFRQVSCVFSHEEVNASWTIPKETESDPFFTCTLKEGTVFSITKSSDDFVSMSLSTPTGLLVQLLRNGKVGQRFVHQSDSTKKLNEISRIIGPDGSISRYLVDDLVQVLLPNSAVITKQKDLSWVAYGVDGTKTVVDASQTALTEKCNLLHASYPDLKRNVVEREDMTYTTVDEDQVLVQYPDGTRVTLRGSKGQFACEDAPYKLPGDYVATVEKLGYATVVTGAVKDQTKVILPNGTVVTRGARESGNDTVESYIFIEQHGLSVEADTLGNVFVNHVKHTDFDSGLRTLFSGNWITGDFNSIDYSGSKFEIDSQGITTVTVSSDNASKFQKPASPLKSAVGENLKSLISGKVPLPSPVQGNLPRLFAIREDGSGTELLRDDQLLAYFKDAVKDPETEVIEERLQEGGALSIIVVKPLHVSKSRNLVYRQLNRYPPLDTSRRLQVKAEVQKYREWFEAEAKDSERYTVAELNRDALPVDTTHQSSQTQTLLLGANKRITEEFILKKYQIKEAHNQSEKIVSFAKKDQNDHRAHWMKPRLLKGTQKSAKALSGAPPPVSAVVKPAQQKIVSASEIPGYFKSVEAAQFLPEINWLNDQVRSEKEAQRATRLAAQKELEANQLQADALSPSIVLSASQLITEDVGLSPEPAEEEPILDSEEEAEADDFVAPLKGHSKVRSAGDNNPLKIDVNGKPRQGRVRLPSFIKASKPGAIVNSQFIRVEGGRRRTLKTASTAMISSSYVLGSFEVLPSHARFGVVRQGGVYSTYLTLTNVSNDSTRFLVKKPKSSNLTVNYKKGPVAPGMRVHVELLLDAKNLSSQEVIKLDDELVIVTEAEYLHIPVSAEIRAEAVFGTARMRASVLIVKPHAAVATSDEQ